MDCVTFEISGRKVVKRTNGAQTDFQCFASVKTAEEFVERECLVYMYRIPRCDVVVDQK